MDGMGSKLRALFVPPFTLVAGTLCGWVDGTMLGTLASLLSPLISGFILMIGFGLVGILLPVRMGLEQMSTDTIGMVLSMYAVGMLLGGLYSKNLINRAGHIRMFAACAAFAAISILACGLYTSAILWGVMRMCMGFCNACAFTAIDSWLSGMATQETRGRILATNQISIMTAIFIGQFGLNIAAPETNTLFVLAGMFMSLAVIPMVMSRSSGPPLEDGGSMPIKKLIVLSPLGVTTCFFGGVLYTGALSMLPLFARGYGIEGLQLSQFMGAAVFGALALQFPVGYLSDRMDRRTLMLGMLLLCLLAGSAVPVAAALGSFPLMMVAIAFAIGIMACLYPMAISETFDKVQQKDLVTAMGSLVAVYALGSMVGPYSASLTMQAFGVDSLFVFLAVMEAALLLFIGYRMSVREARPVDEQESYVPMMYEAGNVIELDPRSEYTPTEALLGAEARYALSVAEDRPGLAVNIVKEMGALSPLQATRLAGSMAQVDGVNAVRLYNAISNALPDSKVELAEAVAAASPEHAAEIIRQVVEEHPDDLNDYVSAVAMAVPDSGMDVVTAAADALMDDSPEEILEMTQAYASSMTESREEMRPADRDAEQYDDGAAADFVTMVSEAVPEDAVDIAAAMVEAIPESASEVIDSLNESDLDADALSSDWEEYQREQELAARNDNGA